MVFWSVRSGRLEHKHQGAIVPSEETIGPIAVTTPGGSATSSKNFKVKA